MCAGMMDIVPMLSPGRMTVTNAPPSPKHNSMSQKTGIMPPSATKKTPTASNQPTVRSTFAGSWRNCFSPRLP